METARHSDCELCGTKPPYRLCANHNSEHVVVDQCGRLLQVEAINSELIKALTDLSAMYTSAWDRVDGSLVMMDSGITRFEAAHAQARAALTKARA